MKSTQAHSDTIDATPLPRSRSSLVRNSLALAISQAVFLYAGGIRAEDQDQDSKCIVNTKEDDVPADDLVTTFRECLAEAEAGKGNFVIDFDLTEYPSTITYKPANESDNSAFAFGESGSSNYGEGLHSLTIDGDVNNDGVPDIILDAGKRALRTLRIRANDPFDLTIDGLVITGGETDGSTNLDGDGAGLHIYSAGNVDLRNSTITGNSAESDGNAAVVIKTDLNDRLNVSLDNVSITENDGVTIGGLIAEAADVVIANSVISNNAGTGADVEFKYTTTVSNSRIENNTRSTTEDDYRSGYGLILRGYSYNYGEYRREYGPEVSVIDSSISGNANLGMATAILHADEYGNLPTPTVRVENSSLIGNGAGGATQEEGKYGGLSSIFLVYADSSPSGTAGRVSVLNSTISGNSGPQVFTYGISGADGEATEEKFNVDIVNSTIVAPAENTNPAVSTRQSNQFRNEFGGKYGAGVEPQVKIVNSVIVAGENAAGNCLTAAKYLEIYGEIYGEGGPQIAYFSGMAAHSILGPTTDSEDTVEACAPDPQSFLIGGPGGDDPATLGDVLDFTRGTDGLVRVGGITQVYPLAAGSVAVDNGDNNAFEAVCTGDAACAGVDQRGADRPETAGGTVDIGAYEAFADGDNIPPSEEGQVPGVNGSAQGDGNGDGIPDSSQENVSSGIAASGPAGPIYATLTATDRTNPNDALQFTNEAWNPTVPPGAPPGSFPLGGFTFTVAGFAPGDTVALELFIPASLGAIELNKFINETWLPLPSTLETVGNRTKFTFSIEDGGPFDADGIANGSITDPVFPTAPATAPATPVPAMPWYSLPILSGLLALLGWRQRRRQRR